MTEDGAIVIYRMCGSPVSISIMICHHLSRSVKIYLGHMGPIMINNVQVPSAPKVFLVGI